MPHSAAVLAEALHLAKQVRTELADLGGRLRLSLGEMASVSLRAPTATMAPVPGLDGVWWLQLPCAYPEAPTCMRLIVGGLAGAICPLAQHPHETQYSLMEGALLWWQHSHGRDENGERIYKKYEKNDRWALAMEEPHGFVVAEDFICYGVYSPFPTD